MSGGRPDVALDVRETSHMSAGMLAYVRALRRYLPQVAPDLRIAEVGRGDNFDLAEQVGLPFALARMRPRLAHFTTPYVPRFVPVPYVVTVHDLIDLEFPQYAKRKVAPYWHTIVGPVLRGARAVITDDDVTVGLLERYLGVDPDRVAVCPLGVDAPDPLPEPAVRARPYLFYAGNHRRHKNLETLVRAWATLPHAYEVDLVMTGPDNAALRAAGDRGERGELVFLGDVSESAVWAYHLGAALYVHPALREGFGLPMLEALRVGTPVIASMQSAPAALAGAVDVYDACDVDALRALLAIGLDGPSLRVLASRVAPEVTERLTWERTARGTAEIYRSVLGGRR
ncbi:MAG TPA: glycosyltransferase family 1 protein [Candidatus Elarobacter sp.]